MKISVIIPAYNCEKYIYQTLDCLKYQTLKEIEVIVVQDACTDNTSKVIDKYIKDNKTLKIKNIINNKNRGPAYVRNLAINNADGEYIHFMDADDFIDIDFYEQLYKLAKDADADIACSGFLNERYPKDSIIYNSKIVVSEPQDKIDYTKVDIFGFSPRYIINLKFWRENNFIFPEDMYHCEDLALLPKVIHNANRIVLSPDVFYHYKNRANSLITDKSAEKSAERNANYKKAIGIRDDFLISNKLKKSDNRIIISKYKLFGVIPVAYLKHYPEEEKSKLYIFGILACRKKKGHKSERPTK